MEHLHKIHDDDELEIDLLELLAAYKKKLWLIILTAVIGGEFGWAFSNYVLIPQYTSTAMVYVISKETTLASLADLQIGSQLTKDYQVIIKSRPVLQEVIDKVGLDMTYQQLRKKLKIDNPEDTRILTLEVKDPDPLLAKEIVDQVASTASDYIGDIMEMVPPRLIEDGEVALIPSSPSKRRNTLLGAAAAAALVCGIITVEVVLNDTVRTEEDVERYLELSVLASVPEREGERKTSKKEKNREVAGRSRKKKKRKSYKEGRE